MYMDGVSAIDIKTDEETMAEEERKNSGNKAQDTNYIEKL